MQTVKIKITDRKNDDSKHVETRFVELESDRRITGAIARRILQREFPELGYISLVRKTEAGWSFERALEPVGKCDYHYVWRRYDLTPA